MQRSLAQLLFAAVLLLASSGVHAQSTQFLDAFAHPESVVIDAGTGTAYVSNIGTDLAPMAKDGDGFISKVTPDGIIESLRFLPRDSTEALHAPKGMAILAGTLYVADVDRIVGFDLSTRAQVFAVDLSGFGTQFLNDLAVFDGRTLLASATDIGTVFRVPVGDPPEATVLVEGIEGVNGVHVDSDNVLYTVSFGGDGGLRQIPLDAYATPTGSTALLSTEGTQLDGLALLPDGRILVSDWTGDDETNAGAMRVFIPGRESLRSLPMPEPVQGPADFYYDAEASLLWVPALPESRVVIMPLAVD